MIYIPAAVQDHGVRTDTEPPYCQNPPTISLPTFLSFSTSKQRRPQHTQTPSSSPFSSLLHTSLYPLYPSPYPSPFLYIPKSPLFHIFPLSSLFCKPALPVVSLPLPLHPQLRYLLPHIHLLLTFFMSSLPHCLRLPSSLLSSVSQSFLLSLIFLLFPFVFLPLPTVRRSLPLQ